MKQIIDLTETECWRLLAEQEGFSTVKSEHIHLLMIHFRIKIFPQAKTTKWFAIAESDRSSHAHLADTVSHAVVRAALIKLLGPTILAK